jgi:hypothetical protein
MRNVKAKRKRHGVACVRQEDVSGSGGPIPLTLNLGTNQDECSAPVFYRSTPPTAGKSPK